VFNKWKSNIKWTFPIPKIPKKFLMPQSAGLFRGGLTNFFQCELRKGITFLHTRLTFKNNIPTFSRWLYFEPANLKRNSNVYLNARGCVGSHMRRDGSGSELQADDTAQTKKRQVAEARRTKRQSLKQHLIRGCGHLCFPRTLCLPGLMMFLFPMQIAWRSCPGSPTTPGSLGVRMNTSSCGFCICNMRANKLK